MRRAAERHLAARHVGLAYAFVHRNLGWTTYSLRLDRKHAVSVALCSIVKSVHRFDPTRGCRFSTYAWTNIRRALYDEWLDFYEISQHHGKTLNRLAAGKTPNCKPKAVLLALQQRRLRMNTVSLDCVRAGPVLDPRPFEPTVWPNEVAALHTAIRHLPPNKRFVVEALYGVGCQPWKSNAIAAKLGLSRSRVLQLKLAAIEDLGHLMQGRVPARCRKKKGGGYEQEGWFKKKRPANEVPPHPAVLCKLQTVDAGIVCRERGVRRILRSVVHSAERRVRCV